MSTDASARCLVIAELSGDSVSQGTLSAITAANKITNNVSFTDESSAVSQYSPDMISWTLNFLKILNIALSL